MRNRLFNAHYLRAISAIGTPLFTARKPRAGRHGGGRQSGGMLGIVMDQSMRHGLPLTFFGVTAMTATSAADLALKYGTNLIPIQAFAKRARLRHPGGGAGAAHQRRDHDPGNQRQP